MPIQTTPEMEQLQKEIEKKKIELTNMKMALPPKTVDDYIFENWNGGETKLSEMFGHHQNLVLIHNMGEKCKYCTMWANGFEGIYKHFHDKAGFVLVNHDTIEQQKKFNLVCGWTFPIYSTSGNSFSKDLGFADENNNPWLGVSTFRKNPNGKIELIAQASFGPGDEFCSTWHFYDLLPGNYSY